MSFSNDRHKDDIDSFYFLPFMTEIINTYIAILGYSCEDLLLETSRVVLI